MIIKCQEHYEKTVKYAESIGDETLNKCIERLKQWEANSKTGMKLNCTTILRHIHSAFRRWQKMGKGGLSEGCSIMETRINHLP